MRILMTGSTGVLGRAALPLLVRAGHDVTALTRTTEAHAWVRALGGRPKVVDLLDERQVDRAVEGQQVVLNLASSIPPLSRMGRPRAWRTNDELRRTATGYLVAAASRQVAELFVQASITFNYADQGDRWIDEDAPLDPPFAATRSALDAEESTRGFTDDHRRGVVLRLGRLYDGGRASGELRTLVRAGRNVVIGDGRNLVASLHSADAGAALAASIGLPAGVYNVADEPVRTLALAETLSAVLSAPPPRHVPRWMARAVFGPGTALLTRSQRVSSSRFRSLTGWAPRYPDAIAGWHAAADLEAF
jgi:nucleoside-diphosphate-sugar epimerase